MVHRDGPWTGSTGVVHGPGLKGHFRKKLCAASMGK